MILVNVKKSGRNAATDMQLREAAAGNWVLADDTIKLYGDTLAAVRGNLVVGHWEIVGHYRVTAGQDEGRVCFELGEADPSLVGEPSPVQWVRGAANPVKIFDSEEGRQASSQIELTAQGNSRVSLLGWSLIVYPDGRARVSPPADGGKLVVESAFPGPSGANVTVRLEPAPS